MPMFVVALLVVAVIMRMIIVGVALMSMAVGCPGIGAAFWIKRRLDLDGAGAQATLAWLR